MSWIEAQGGPGAIEERTRARFLAEFTLSGQCEILRCAQDDSEGLGMTSAQGLFSDQCNGYFVTTLK
jgi:hypothetical protein